MLKIWIDMKNAHEPAFFKKMMDFLREKGCDIIVSCRGNTEVPELVANYLTDFKVIGKHTEKGMKQKLFFFIARNIGLLFGIPHFDVSLNFISANAIQTAKLRRKPVISFTDNDFYTYWNKLSLKYIDYLIVPEAVSEKNLVEQGAKPDSIIPFPGFKEEIYIADYCPDETFQEKIPFQEYVVVRPEALACEYIRTGTGSITYELVDAFQREGLRVVYLARYKDDPIRYRNLSHVFIPPQPLNGLDLCWHARAVLSGSGTLSREAACLGIPAVSFYPGDDLLSVDRHMVEQGLVFHSRKVSDIIRCVLNSDKRKLDLDRCKKVRDYVFDLLDSIIQKYV